MVCRYSDIEVLNYPRFTSYVAYINLLPYILSIEVGLQLLEESSQTTGYVGHKWAKLSAVSVFLYVRMHTSL